MLKELRVRDLALVAESTVRFGKGLNLLTGETGSGKSLIIDALSLALGARGGADQVRHGADRATVEAVFDAVSLQREIGKRSGARIDGRTASPSQLRELGNDLVAIHGQHEHHALLDTDTQTELLDAYGALLSIQGEVSGSAGRRGPAGGAAPESLRAAVVSTHAAWMAAASALRDLEQLRSRGRREEEYLRWQLDELRNAELKPGEDDSLTAERTATRHAARLAELGQQAVDALHEDGLARASVAVGSAAALDGRLADQASRLQLLAEEMADVAAAVRHYMEMLDSDPRRLEAIESRLAVLDGVKRKYGGSLEAAIQEMKRLELQVGATQDLDSAVAWAKDTRDGDVSHLGITGFCWGGRIVWLYAAHNPKLRAAVAWYGRLDGGSSELQPHNPLDLVAAIKAPVLGLYAGHDQGTPESDVEKMREALKKAGKNGSIMIYPDAQHGFNADYRPSYNAADAQDGWKRMLIWFQAYGVGPKA